MKQTIIQCVTALLCVVAIAVTSVISVGKLSTAKVEAAKAAAANSSNTSSDSSVADSSDSTSDTLVDADTSSDSADDTAADGTDADEGDSTDADAASSGDTSSSDASSTGSTGSSSSSTASTTKATSSVPSTKADIAAYYNTAVNKVVSSKAGFTKKRVTTLSNLEGGALMKISLVVDTVNDFLGVGTNTITNTKGKAGEISKASLTADDLSEATCKQSGDNYVITLTLKSGTSKADSSSSSDSTALGRTGLYAGTGDKKAYDYKNASNIYTGINNVDKASVESVVENNKNIKITATVNSKTGNISALHVGYDWDVALTTVKYTAVKISSATGNATTSVDFSNFSF